MSSSWITEALVALDAALHGAGPPLEFLPAQDGQPPRWIPRPEASTPEDASIPEWGRVEQRNSAEKDPETALSAPPFAGERVAAVVRTSGSTGTPKQTLLSAQALQSAAEMAMRALGGHGQWLLTLQPSYVAGLAVLTRSLAAGTVPVALLEETTDPQRFTAAAAELTADRRYVSLVPTQLTRLLDHDDDALLAALRRFDAILLGGGHTPPELFAAAREAGLKVIRTYGMAETCGGCLYDGYPLPGVAVELGTHGRVLISGPMTALGYLENPGLTAEHFDTDPATGQRRYRTDDLGALGTDQAEQLDTLAQVVPAGQRTQVVPKLSVTGRADDVIITGAVKISAEAVRQAIESHPRVREAFVTGVKHPEWGHQVTAAVVLSSVSRSAATFEEIDQRVREHLGPAAVPKHYELLGALPELANGKPDRQELIRLLARTASAEETPATSAD